MLTPDIGIPQMHHEFPTGGRGGHVIESCSMVVFAVSSNGGRYHGHLIHDEYPVIFHGYQKVLIIC